MLFSPTQQQHLAAKKVMLFRHPQADRYTEEQAIEAGSITPLPLQAFLWQSIASPKIMLRVSETEHRFDLSY